MRAYKEKEIRDMVYDLAKALASIFRCLFCRTACFVQCAGTRGSAVLHVCASALPIVP